MDYQNRAGSKFGGGGVASQSATNADRRERLRKLALETIDLDKDPYFFKNHVGSFECRLCLTVHQNDGSYLAHTQGRKHQTNLARRAAKDAQMGKKAEEGYTGANAVQVKRNIVKIGRPGYSVTKTRDPITRQEGLLFSLQYPEITQGVEPRVRFMSAYEQKVEDPPDKAFQYLLVAAEPYETCGFKIQARDIDRREEKYWTWWDVDSKQFWVQINFKTEREERFSGYSRRLSWSASDEQQVYGTPYYASETHETRTAQHGSYHGPKFADAPSPLAPVPSNRGPLSSTPNLETVLDRLARTCTLPEIVSHQHPTSESTVGVYPL
ncbi:hypothetical protein BST61_g4339 [Cercospora zeina]